MRAYCERRQRQAVAGIAGRRPPNDIRLHCAHEWPRDFTMRDYCERKQVESYEQLKR